MAILDVFWRFLCSFFFPLHSSPNVSLSVLTARVKLLAANLDNDKIPHDPILKVIFEERICKKKETTMVVRCKLKIPPLCKPLEAGQLPS